MAFSDIMDLRHMSVVMRDGETRTCWDLAIRQLVYFIRQVDLATLSVNAEPIGHPQKRQHLVVEVGVFQPNGQPAHFLLDQETAFGLAAFLLVKSRDADGEHKPALHETWKATVNAVNKISCEYRRDSRARNFHPIPHNRLDLMGSPDMMNFYVLGLGQH